MPNNQPTRPFCLEYEDARNEVFAAVNTAMRRHDVPVYLMEGILREVLTQAKDGARAERERAQAEYEQALRRTEKDGGATDE